MTPDTLTELLHRHIPLTAAMQVRVSACNETQVMISAPLQPNLNIHGTAFGGSLAILGILSGWTLLHHALQVRGIAAKIVIQKNECEFLEPVEQEFTAEAVLPEAAQWESFLAALQRNRRARIRLNSEVRAGAGAAVKSSGTFVAIL